MHVHRCESWFGDGWPQPPPGFRCLCELDHKHGGIVILAHRDNESYAITASPGYDVCLAVMSDVICTYGFVPRSLDHNDPSSVNHGGIAYPIGWLPLDGTST